MNFINTSELRKNLSEIIDKSEEGFIIMKNGRPTAVLICIDEWKSIKALRRLMTNPENMMAVAKTKLFIKEQQTKTKTGENNGS